MAGLWGLTVSLVKSKGMVVGTGSLLSPIPVGDGFIDVVEDFQYLGSCISSDGVLDMELSGHLAKAAKMFGCLHSSIFVNGSLSIAIKRCVYTAIVVSTLLYGAETWAIKAPQVRRLQSFHNRYIRCILGVSRHLQWRDHITTEQLALEFGMTEGMDVLLALCRLRWLGHVGRMEADRLPKQILFGELLFARPFHGPKLRWRDVVRDLRIIRFDATSWYSAVQDRGGWYDAFQTFASRSVPTASGPVVVAGSFVCECDRMIRRRGDLTCHHNFCDCQPQSLDHLFVNVAECLGDVVI